MKAGDVIARVRVLLADPSASGRYSDTELLGLVGDAQADLTQRTQFPQSMALGLTVANVQEYSLPDGTQQVKRVYLAGQPLIPTSIPALQGDQIGFWDQTSGAYTPQWVYAPASTYPVSSYIGGYNATNVPYYPGVRPQYYLRGQTTLGIMPMPAGVFQLAVHVVNVPAPPASDGEYCGFPMQAKDALAWYIVKQELFGDRKDDLFQIADAEYEKSVRKFTETIQAMNDELPAGPIMRTYRNQFRGRIRPTGGCY